MKKLTLEQLIELGDKIHNAEELICITHNYKKDKDIHDLHFSMMCNSADELAHLVAKNLCDYPDFFKVVVVALDKLDFKVTKK